VGRVGIQGIWEDGCAGAPPRWIGKRRALCLVAVSQDRSAKGRTLVNTNIIARRWMNCSKVWRDTPDNHGPAKMARC